MKDILPIAFKKLINALEDIEENYKIKYYLVGGLLVNLYSVFRVTQDIDFVVDIETEKISINNYISILKKYKFNPLQDWIQAGIIANETGILQYFDISNRVKIDNYFVERNNLTKYKRLGPLGLKRRTRKTIFGIECWVVSKEDFILSKLVFGGWQDFSDALGCWLRFKDDLDISYLNKTCKILTVKKELELLISGIEDPDEYFEKLNGYIE